MSYKLFVVLWCSKLGLRLRFQLCFRDLSANLCLLQYFPSLQPLHFYSRHSPVALLGLIYWEGGAKIGAYPELCHGGLPGYAWHTKIVSGLGVHH